MAIDFKQLIKKGPSQKPPRIVMIGVEGVGKSTAGAQMPSPIFLCAEDGLVGHQFAETPSVSPRDWPETLAFLDWLATEAHEFKTLVVDTLDWIEPRLFAHVVAAAKKPDIRQIEDFGFGKGYVLAADEFRQFLARLDRVNARGMSVLVLAHSQVKAFNNPLGDNYDRYEPKVAKQVAGLVKEWADCVLFAMFDVFTRKDGSKVKGQGGQVRVVHTEHCAAWDAKNRYGLPATLPLDMPVILEEIARGQPADTSAMAAEIREIAEGMDEDKRKATLAWLDKKPTAQQLAQLLNKIRITNPKDKE